MAKALASHGLTPVSLAREDRIAQHINAIPKKKRQPNKNGQ